MTTSPYIPSCFRAASSAADDDHHHPPPAPPVSAISGNSNLTTCLYQTQLGVFSLTWSRTFFGHSLNLFLHSQDYYCHSSPLPLSADLSLPSLFSFRLHINPFAFWRKLGCRRVSPKVQILWDLSRVKFGSGPEPRSGFYIAVVVDGDMGLLVGDCAKEAYARTRAERPMIPQALFLRREHVFGSRVFCTKSRIGSKNREISIDCVVDEDARLCFSIDKENVLQIKRLRWKFRGNEKIEIDGVNVQISWDVYNWLFDNNSSTGNNNAVFMFRLDAGSDGAEEEEFDTTRLEKKMKKKEEDERNGIVSSFRAEWRRRMMRRRSSLLRSARSSSSSSISASSACCSSVLEWASSTDESEYGGGAAGGGGGGAGGVGFSLLVYAWRK